MFDAVAAVMPHFKAGKLRLLAAGRARRSPFLPEVPTMQEAGVPGYVNASWGAVIAPARTPRALVERLNADIVAILNEPDTKERLAVLSAEVTASSSEDAAAYMRSEEVRLTKLIRDVGIPPE